jgi:hypothetical protein
MRARSWFFVVGGALVVVVIALLGELVVPRVKSRVVNVGNVHSLTPGTPMRWRDQLWVILDKRGDVHAFPATYEATSTHSYTMVWLDERDSIAKGLLDADRCARAVGDGIFYVQSPSGTRFDATGRHLFGAERPTLDWFETTVNERGEISVDLGKRHRTEYPSTGTVHGSEPKPGAAATATPSPVPTPPRC